MTRTRGITLLEIVIALGVSSIALAGAVLAARSQQATYYAGHRTRAAQEAARSALLALEQRLPMAGYGMDAPLALDFQGWYDPAANGTCPSELSPCSADRTDDSDEITLYARNPAFWVPREYGAAIEAEPAGRAWKPVSLSGDTLTIRAHKGDVFRKGQILQIVCSGLMKYAYVTVDATTPATGTVPNEGDSVDLALAATVAADPFKQQGAAAALECIDTAAGTYKAEAKVFQIDRFRFHVRPVDVGGGQLDPFLVLDQGVDSDLDGDVDPDDEELIAEGIESIQLAYAFAEPTIPVAGATPGTALTVADGTAAAPGTAADTIVTTRFLDPNPLAAGKSVYDYSSFYSYSTVKIPDARKTNAQANIRQVLVSVVARSPTPDPQGLSNLRYTAGSQLYRLNQDAAPDWITSRTRSDDHDGYDRTVVDTAVNLPNMITRSISYF